jgi:hypothetical protein
MAVADRMRDVFLLDVGSCLAASLLGCRSQLLLVAPSLGRLAIPST